MPTDLIPTEARYKKLARKVAEGSIVTDALARLIEQIIAEVHDSRIEPQAARIAELEAEVARKDAALAQIEDIFRRNWNHQIEKLQDCRAIARAARAAPDTGGAGGE